MIKFKIGIFRQLLLFGRISLLYVGIYLCILFTSFQINKDALFIVFLIFFLIDTLPAIIVHVQYIFHEADKELEFNSDTKILIYSHEKNVKASELTSIIKVESYYSYGGGTGWYSFAEYEFYRITFSTGEKIIITNLRVPNFEKFIKEETILIPEKRLKLVCFLPPLGKL